MGRDSDVILSILTNAMLEVLLYTLQYIKLVNACKLFFFAIYSLCKFTRNSNKVYLQHGGVVFCSVH